MLSDSQIVVRYRKQTTGKQGVFLGQSSVRDIEVQDDHGMCLYIMFYQVSLYPEVSGCFLFIFDISDLCKTCSVLCFMYHI